MRNGTNLASCPRRQYLKSRGEIENAIKSVVSPCFSFEQALDPVIVFATFFLLFEVVRFF